MGYADYQGITVKVGTAVVGELLSLDALINKSRAVKTYNPINSDNQIVATGRIVQGALSLSLLYDASGTEGVNLLEAAFDDNTQVTMTFEMNDSLGLNGTTITRTVRVSSFKVVGEEDGKYKADVSIETIGIPTVTAAA